MDQKFHYEVTANIEPVQRLVKAFEQSEGAAVRVAKVFASQKKASGELTQRVHLLSEENKAYAIILSRTAEGVHDLVKVQELAAATADRYVKQLETQQTQQAEAYRQAATAAKSKAAADVRLNKVTQELEASQRALFGSIHGLSASFVPYEQRVKQLTAALNEQSGASQRAADVAQQKEAAAQQKEAAELRAFELNERRLAGNLQLRSSTEQLTQANLGAISSLERLNQANQQATVGVNALLGSTDALASGAQRVEVSQQALFGSTEGLSAVSGPYEQQVKQLTAALNEQSGASQRAAAAAAHKRNAQILADDLNEQQLAGNLQLRSSTEQLTQANLGTVSSLERFNQANQQATGGVNALLGSTNALASGQAAREANEQRLTAAVNVQLEAERARNREYQQLVQHMSSGQNVLLQSTTETAKLTYWEKSRYHILKQVTPLLQLSNNANRQSAAATQQAGAAAQQAAAQKKQLAWAYKHLEQSAAASTKEITISWQSIMRLVQVQVLHRIFAMLSRYLRDATREAMEFNIAMAELQTISLKSAATVTDWTNQLRHLNREFGSPMPQLAEAAYQGLSNQVMQSVDDMNYLREAVRLATVAVGTMDQAVGASTSLINAFSLSARDASHVHGLLFKTIEMGRVRLEEMADSLGRVSMLASQLGVTVAEQQAAFATLTIQGVKFNVAQTLLSNVLLKLIKPSERMLEIMGDYGVASGEAAIAAYGLTGFLNILAAEAQKSNDVMSEFGEQWGRLRAMTGAAGLIFNMETYHKTLAEMQKGAEDFDEALARIMENPAKKLSIELEKVKAMFQVEWGNTLIRWGEGFVKIFGGLDKAVTMLIKAFRNLAITMAVMKFAVPALATAYARYTAVTGTAAVMNAKFGFSITALQVKLALAKAAVIGLGAAFMKLLPFLAISAIMALADSWGKAKRELEAYTRELEQARMVNQQAMQEMLSTQVRAATQAYSDQMRTVLGFVAYVRGETGGLLKDLEAQTQGAIDTLVNSFREYGKEAVENIKAIEKAQNELTKTLQDAQKTQEQLAREREGRDLGDEQLLERARAAREQAARAELQGPEGAAEAEKLRRDADVFEKAHDNRIKAMKDHVKELEAAVKEEVKIITDAAKAEHEARGGKAGDFIAPEFDLDNIDGVIDEIDNITSRRRELQQAVGKASLANRKAAQEELAAYNDANGEIQRRLKMLRELRTGMLDLADIEAAQAQHAADRIRIDEAHERLLERERPRLEVQAAAAEQQLELEKQQVELAKKLEELDKLDIVDDVEEMEQILGELFEHLTENQNVWTDAQEAQLWQLNNVIDNYLQIKGVQEELIDLQARLNEQTKEHAEYLGQAADAKEGMFGEIEKSANQMATLAKALEEGVPKAAVTRAGRSAIGFEEQERRLAFHREVLPALRRDVEEYQRLTSRPLTDEAEVQRAAELQGLLNAQFNDLLQLNLVSEFDELTRRISVLTGLDELAPQHLAELVRGQERLTELEPQLEAGEKLRKELENVGVDLDAMAREVTTTNTAIGHAFDAYNAANALAANAAEAMTGLTGSVTALQELYADEFTEAQKRLQLEGQANGLLQEQVGLFDRLNAALTIAIPGIRNLGGRRFQHGGLVRGPGGIDRVPAMLTAGEYVWDRETTQKFYPLIRQLHTQQRTPTKQPLTNNYGNINVTVHGADSPQLTAHAVLKEMKRELRRGTI